MPRLTLKTCLLLSGYFAVCATIYVGTNAAVGWVVVIATALLIAYSMFRSFMTRSMFGLGFAVVSSIFLSVCLGCAFETSTKFSGWDVRGHITNTIGLGREYPEIGDNWATAKRTKYHDMYSSVTCVQPTKPVIPSHWNSIRLGICLASLLAGLLGGATFAVFDKQSVGR